MSEGQAGKRGFGTLVEALQSRAASTPETVAYTWVLDAEGDREAVEARLTYRELDRTARRVAGALQSVVERGARVLVICPPGLGGVSAIFGCWYADTVAVPIPCPEPIRPTRLASAVRAISGHCKPRAIVCTEAVRTALLGRAEELGDVTSLSWVVLDSQTADDKHELRAKDLTEQSLAYLQYSLRSVESKPTCLAVTHGALVDRCAAASSSLGCNAETVSVTWELHRQDVGPAWGIALPMYAGYRSVLLSPAQVMKQPARWLRAISQFKATFSAAHVDAYEWAAATITDEQKAGLSLASWSVAAVLGSPVTKGALQRFESVFSRCGLGRAALRPVYEDEFGVFVCAGTGSSVPAARDALLDSPFNGLRCAGPQKRDPDTDIVTVPQTVEGVRLAVVDPATSTECPPNRLGEIWLSAPYAQSWNDGQVVSPTQRLGNHTFLRTGDVGFVSEGGVAICGRAEDLVVVGDTFHFPDAIERSMRKLSPVLRAGRGVVLSVESAGASRVAVLFELERRFIDASADNGASRALSNDELIARMREAVKAQFDIEPHAIVLLKVGSLPIALDGRAYRAFSKNAFLGGSLEALAEWRAPLVRLPTGKDASVEVIAELFQPHVRRIVATLLRTGSPEELDPKRPFGDLGLSSVLAIQVGVEVAQLVGTDLSRLIELSPTFVYSYPSVEALAGHLAEQVFAPSRRQGDSGAPRPAPAPQPRIEVESRPPPSATFAGPEPLAIVGLGARFGGGMESAEALWLHLRHGDDLVRATPSDRWDVDGYYDPQIGRPGKICSRFGGFLDEVDKFDAGFFAISPREALSLDPQHRMVLETAWDAIVNAGIAPRRLAGTRTGVFLGIQYSEYGQLQVRQNDTSSLDKYYATGNHLNAAAGRLSYFLGFRGPCVAIDTACSSSLTAVHLAAQSLRSRESDVALAGGVNMILSPDLSAVLSMAGLLSPDGRCKTFDAAADGYVRAEGCGVAVLKRLSDAIADRDRILALVRGSMINQDGKSTSLTAPNGHAQELVIRDALTRAGVNPGDVAYMEAHGTGTVLGDPLEINALRATVGVDSNVPLRVSTVKTNLGHLEAAAGIAGIIKAVMSLVHDEIPPHLHLRELNKLVELRGSRMRVPAEVQPWSAHGGSRIASVSGFSFTGSNAHIILQEAPPVVPVTPAHTRPVHLLALSARTERALRVMVERFLLHTLENPSVSLADLCAGANAVDSGFRYRVAITAENHEQLLARLRAFLADEPIAGCVTGNVSAEAAQQLPAFVFVGEGVPAGVGRELYQSQRTFRRAFDRCAELVKEHLAKPLGEVLYGDQHAALSEPGYAEAATFAFEWALAEMWRSWGVQPGMVQGQNVGEQVAACAAGALAVDDVLPMLARPGAAEGIKRLTAKPPRITIGKGAPTGAAVEIGRRDHGAWREALAGLADLYVRGADVAWTEVDADYVSRRVPPPAYPFERDSYWFNRATGGAGDAAPAKPDVVEAVRWLGRRTDLATGDIVYETEVSGAGFPWLEDHRLYGPIVVPGASHVARVLMAAEQIWKGSDGTTLTNLGFREAVVLDEGERRIVQLVLRRKPDGADGALGFEVLSRPQTGTTWTLHASGDVAPIAPGQAKNKVDLLATVRARCPSLFPAKEVYANFMRAGLDLGPTFQVIQGLWVGSNEAITKLRVPDAAAREARDYPIHPGLMDAYVQSCANYKGPIFKELPIPFSFERMNFHRRVPRDTFCHVAQRKDVAATKDLRSYDENGDLVFEVLGYTDLPAPRHLFQARTQAQSASADIYYRFEWRDAPRAAQPAPAATNRSWIFLADRGGVAAAAMQRLRNRGDRVVSLSWTSPADPVPGAGAVNPMDAAGMQQALAMLSSDAAPTDIVHTWSLDLPNGEQGSTSSMESQGLAVASLLHLVQAINKAGFSRPPRLNVVTRNAQVTSPADRDACLAAAPVWGLNRVIGLESPDLRVRAIDVDDGADDGRAERLVAELLDDGREDQIALRGTKRSVLRVVRGPGGALPRAPLALASDGSYLIAGGLGGLGREIATWMLAAGAGHVLLLSRSDDKDGFARRVDPAGRRLSFARADVTDFESVKRAVALCGTKLPPLRGVINCAAVLDDGILGDLTWPRFERVLASKVLGSLNLHRATTDRQLDFFVMFSSIAGMLGTPGQGNYSAANVWLDTFAAYRANRGLPALSIGWGAWAEVGATIENERRMSNSTGRGVRPLGLQEGLAVLGSLISAAKAPDRVSHVGVFPLDWSVFVKRLGATPPTLSEVAPGAAPAPKAVAAVAKETPTDVSVVQRIKQAPTRDRAEVLSGFVLGEVRSILMLSEQEYIDPSAPLIELGLDSLAAVELRNRLGRALGTTLPVALLFQFPTLEAISEHLLGLPVLAPDAASEGSKAEAVPEQGQDKLATIYKLIGDLSTDDLQKFAEEVRLMLVG